MKIIKRFFALLVALTFMLGLFSTNCNVYADTQKDGYNISISNVSVSPNPVTVGALASLKFDFNIYTLAQNAMNVGGYSNTFYKYWNDVWESASYRFTITCTKWRAGCDCNNYGN